MNISLERVLLVGSMVTFIFVFIVIVSVLFIYWAYQYLCELIIKIPGPRIIPILGNVHNFTSSSRVVKYFLETTQEYHPTCRFWFGARLFVSVSDPNDLETVMRHSKCLHRKTLQHAFQATPLIHGLFAVADEKWKMHRRILSPLFNFKGLVKYLPIFYSKSMVLVKNLKYLANGGSFDVLETITFCTFDIVCETVLGIALNTQDSKDSTLLSCIEDVNKTITEIIIKPWLKYEFIFNKTKQYKVALRANDYIVKVVKKLISDKTRIRQQKCQQDNKTECSDVLDEQPKAFLDIMIEAVDSQNSLLSNEEILSEVVTLMLAGLETTAGTMSFCLLMLAHHSDVQDRVYREVLTIEDNTPPSYQNLQNMKYLEQVIKETLRLYPLVPVVPRICEEPIRLGQYTVPSGATLLLNIIALHRNSQYYSNPQKFNPDNFSPQATSGRHPYAFVPFSGGPRMCIGHKFAMLQMKMVLSMLLRDYVVLPVGRPEDIECLEYQVTLRPAHGFQIRLLPRSRAST